MKTTTAGYDEPEADRVAKASDEKTLEKVRRCFRLATQAEANQREREREDLRFQVPEMQWTPLAAAARKGSPGSGSAPATPERPMLSISKLDQPIQLILNQAGSAQLGVNVHPISEKADDDTAEVMQGLYRRIERDSNADQARLWGFARAVLCGRGAYRVNTKWDEDADPETFDQEIVIERILHQEMVYFDPSAQKPDFSDGEWAICAAWVPVETFEREYPKAEVPTADDFDGMDDVLAPEWVDEGNGEGEDAAVLVVEYIYKKHKYETVKGPNGRTRERDVVTVWSCKCTALDVLSEEELNGPNIPLVPVIGRELIPFDEERRWVGVVNPAKDAQRLYNFSASSVVEGMALEPKAPFIGAKGQFKGVEGQWQQANTRNFPYLEYNPTDVNDKPVPPPQRAQVDSSRMQLAMAALHEADSWIQATTAVHDPSLGRDNPREKSGRAILALQSQSDAGTSHYLSNFKNVSLTCEARIVLGMMPYIYDRPGRITRVLGGEDETKTVMLNAPFVTDPRTKRPVTAKGHPEAKTYNLAEGKYTLSTTIGKSFQTRLQQGQEVLGELMRGFPPEIQLALLPTYLKFQDAPGMKELSEIAKKLRDQKMPGLGEESDNAAQKATAENAQLKGQMQQMGQALQRAMEALKTDQAKHAASVQIEQHKAQVQLQIKAAEAELQIALQRMKDATAIEVKQIDARMKGVISANELEHDAIALAQDAAHGAEQASSDRAHEVAMAHVGHVQGQQAAEMAGQQAAQAQQADQQHAADMQAEQQAAAAQQAQAAPVEGA